jgi:LacI family transcriptional regulator
MRVTLREIARQANVHLGTASYILNGAGGSTRVSDETRRRVLEVADSLGYRANRAAQQLRTRRSGVVGLLTGGLENPFFARLVSLCSAELERAGYDVVLATRRRDESNDLHLLQALSARQLDGILVWSETPTEVRERIQRPDMSNAVILGLQVPGRDSVAAEMPRAIRDALDHLADQGYQRIGYFAPELALNREGDPRHGVYLEWVSERGRRSYVYSYDGAAYDVSAARARAEALADAIRCPDSSPDETPDALLCFNDLAAIGVMMGLRRRGLQVPADVALVGCDDLPLAAELDVPLTTVAYPLADMAAQAVRLLLERIDAPTGEAPPARNVFLEATLLIRESSRSDSGTCAPPSASGHYHVAGSRRAIK